MKKEWCDFCTARIVSGHLWIKDSKVYCSIACERGLERELYNRIMRKKENKKKKKAKRE